MSNGSGADNFHLEWYKLHRGHELELNKATLAYEHERLKFLAYLNGGAATAFLTFFAAMWKESPQPAWWTSCAIGCWVVGLCVAWLAWSFAHRSQSAFTTAYRMRRYSEEFQEKPPGERFGVEERHPAAAAATQPPSLDGLRRAADEWRSVAGKIADRSWWAAHLSVAFFVIGAGCSLCGFAIAGARSNRRHSPLLLSIVLVLS